jgi:hypothetical protein
MTTDSGETRDRFWAGRVFAVRPTAPGFWEFSWSSGQGSGEKVDEKVSFDSARQAFLREVHVSKPQN